MPRSASSVQESFDLADAAAIALEWVAQDLGETPFLMLLQGCQWYDGGPLEALSASTWKVYGSARKWSVTVLEDLRYQHVVGLFNNRNAREAVPMWMWHYLAGRMMLDPGKEVIASGTRPLASYPLPEIPPSAARNDASRRAARPWTAPLKACAPVVDIRRDVPPPPPAATQKHAAHRNAYPWPAMLPGDSVFFPDEPDGAHSRPGWAARQYAKRTGQTFRSAAENGGLRVWRLS